ncbi:uncharacterized protein TNCV_1783751 [Trichonephila clavipes]|nr:uncharacterized protein TNCV_1783751 [Trichonephila clavipes]
MIFHQEDDQAHELFTPFSEEGHQRSQMADLFIVRHEHRSYLQRNDDTILLHFVNSQYSHKQKQFLCEYPLVTDLLHEENV